VLCPQAGSARILAVEDTPALRTLLSLCLTRAGYTVDLADEGQAAVALFLAGTYDAVIMDVQMPVMDGLAAVARMREREKERDQAPVPIFALTANTEPAVLRRCIDAGFTGALRKPFKREELLALLARELGVKSAASAAGAPIIIAADPEFADLIPGFLDNCRRDLEVIGKALELRDYETIAVASHRVTGAGGTFGFQTLSDESRFIEAAAKNTDEAGVRAHLDALKLYLQRVSVVYP